MDVEETALCWMHGIHLDFYRIVCFNGLNALNRSSRYSNPSEKSRLVRDFWKVEYRTSLGAAKAKADVYQKLPPEVTVIRDM